MYDLAYRGHLALLQWAKENGCYMYEELCSSAAGGNHMHVLKWARENGCPWDVQACNKAAETGNLEMLIWLRENGCPWGESTCASGCGGWRSLGGADVGGRE